MTVAAGLPICGLITVSLLSAVHSGFTFVAGFFAAVLAASGVLIGLTGLILRERSWWLFTVSLAANAALFYVVNGISIPPGPAPGDRRPDAGYAAVPADAGPLGGRYSGQSGHSHHCVRTSYKEAVSGRLAGSNDENAMKCCFRAW
ncbi:MAG: hypothetical protein JWM59_3395 [Verrucomicrobiales bacterium]|nr:hypothetical protein [Verrucomicrobiales bacterium]